MIPPKAEGLLHKNPILLGMGINPVTGYAFTGITY